MCPSTPVRTNLDVTDPADRQVVASSIFGGVAVITLGRNVPPRPSAADPSRAFKGSEDIVLNHKIVHRGQQKVVKQSVFYMPNLCF